MKFIIMHETAESHDAIGNDILGMYTFLREKHDCRVFASRARRQDLEYMEQEEMEKAILDPSLILIYHHSINWDYGWKVLNRAKCRIVIRYHNITPPEYFEPYSKNMTAQCRRGWEMTRNMERALPQAFWLCASRFNAGTLNVPEDRIGICPPFHRIGRWKEVIPDESVLREMADSAGINLIFVGRFVPNKGHLSAMKAVQLYCRNYDQKITLRLLGKFGPEMRTYRSYLQRFIRENHLSQNVQLIEEVSEAKLLSYYLGSDLLFCCSDHEGFCVPVAEAQYLCLPVIATAASAVPETLGENQLCLENNPRLLAAAIHTVAESPEYAEFLSRKGSENYQRRFSEEAIRKVFEEELKRSM